MHLHRPLSLSLVLFALCTGCASTTVIRSNPSGAKVLSPSGAVLGRTPYHYSDTQPYGSQTRFTLQMDGYERADVVARRETWNVGRTVGFAIGGLLFWPAWAGLIWAQDYQPEYVIDLEPEAGHGAPTQVSYTSPAPNLL